jgi:integrase
MQDEIASPTSDLTRDNHYLSRPNLGRVPGSAGDCTDLPAAVAGFVRASLADNTRRAYLSDLRHFEHWGGRIPASAETVASYLAAHVDTLRVATLVRRIASISKAHQARGVPNPTRSELVRTTLRGIKRTRRCTQQQAKALLREDLLLVLDTMGDDLKDIRDRALLLIGFAGALRRSELVALDVADIEHIRRGITLHLRHSKTDQDGRGDKIAIPYGRSRQCVRTRRMAGRLWHHRGGDIPAGRSPRPRPWWTPIGRSCLNRSPGESRRCRPRRKAILGPLTTGGARYQRGPVRSVGLADQGANPPCLGRHVGTLHPAGRAFQRQSSRSFAIGSSRARSRSRP